MENFNNAQRLDESRNEIYWIVYQTTNIINNKIYIGVHKTKDPFKFDGYLGNGIYINSPYTYMYCKTKMESAVKKYGVKNFKRTTLQIFNNEEEAYALEAELVNEKFLARSDVYNMILGGKIPPKVYPIKTIYQYDTNGIYIKEFNSITEAANNVNRNPSSISDSCNTNTTCAGYYWSFIKQDKLDLKNYHKLQEKKIIYKYNLKGELVDSYYSTRSTGYTQAANAAILGNIVDKQYYFCYVKAENYSKARDIYVKSRIIYQYDSDGKFLKEWKYVDALKEFKNEGLNQAIRHKKLTKSGFYWGLQKYDIYNQPIKKANRLIGKYDLNNNLICTYENSSSCYKDNGKGVYKNLVGLRKTYKGYIYKYME